VKRVEWANAMRGVAAVTVVVAHFLGVFWLNRPAAAALARHQQLPASISSPWIVRVIESAPVDLAACGVALFFLLSGYVIALSINRYSRRGFILGRCMRIVPTYAVGYGVTCFVSWIASRGSTGPDRVTISRVAYGSIPGLAAVIKQPIVDDGVVWTLIIEVAFYVICLVAYRSLTTRWPAVLLVGMCCLVVQQTLQSPAISRNVPSSLSGFVQVVGLVCPFLPIMLIGVVLASIGRGAMRRGAAFLVPALALLYWWMASTTEAVPTSLKYRFSFVLCALIFVAIWRTAGGWRSVKVIDLFADVSYPLYVVHGVLGYALMFWLLDRGVSWPLAVAATTVSVFVVAWLLHCAVERPAQRLGRSWARRGRSELPTDSALAQ